MLGRTIDRRATGATEKIYLMNTDYQRSKLKCRR